MHILHVIDSLAIGGAERMLIDIANNTHKDDFRAAVCVTRSNGPLANDLDPSIQLSILERKSRFDIKGIRKFIDLLKRSKPDIIHAHGRSSFSFVAAISTISRSNTPIILHDHYGIEINNSVPKWFKFWGKYKLAYYVGVYEKLALWAEAAGIAAKKIRFINNTLDLSRFDADPVDVRTLFDIPQTAAVGVFVGGIRREKGLHILIDAIAQAKSSRAIKILVVGAASDQAYYSQCREQITELGLSDIFCFTGMMANVAGILKSVDFALIPSISESGPLVLIEYLANGLPFVATQVGGVSQQVMSMGLPGFVSPGDAAIFAQALIQLLDLTTEERHKRGAIGKEIAHQHFDIQQTMQLWHQIYHTVARKRN